jgi:hypothetical protein
MRTVVAIKETHKPLPHHVRAKSGGARNPAPIVVPPEPTDPEPSEALINQVSFFWELRGDAAKLSTSIVRAIRKERKGDGSIDRLFKDTLNSLKQEVAANKLLRAKQRELPDNQKHDYPSIAIGWVGTSEYRCTSASDIVSTFDEWIEKAASIGNVERVSHLKQQ